MPKNKNYFEFVVGSFVLLCALFFFVSSFRSANVGGKSGYVLLAKFDNVDGIKSGSDVKISGVKIGNVNEQFIDEKTYRAELKLTINNGIKIPVDSSVKIASEGLLGSKYLSISPGSSEETLSTGGEIIFTQSSVNFEDLLGKFIFSNNKSSK